MNRYTLISVFLLIITSSLIAQHDKRITTLDFVQILNGNHDEAVFFYENNWKVLREEAVTKGYIESYEFMEMMPSITEPFHFILMTTYADSDQYEKREDHFGKLIEGQGTIKLLNDKQPEDFKKNLFYKENVRHWKQEK